MRDFRGKRALVTGAASGIGRAIALELARAGSDLYLVDVDADGLRTVVDEARSIGVDAIPFRCDLSQPEAITATVRAMLDRGPIDVLVNNAGVVYYGPTENMTGPQWDWLLSINLLAPIQLTRELLPTLLARPDAHVLNVCSISGLVAGGRITAYHTSKFGLVGFTESLRAEFGRRGLGVTALCPGPVTSNLYRSGVSGRPDRAVPDPPKWICATPEAVARKAMKAMRRDRRMVLITPLAHLLYNLKRFAPGLLDLANRIGRKRRRRSAPVEAVPAARRAA